ncbi:MAG TPA: hypothetical protein VHD56_17625 [Tepidisphaeraceae bacterium]|nr:hypothetical protein [Tepidisphaeraceae bacterium]
MPRDTRRSGLSLVLAGLAVIAFSLLTDAKMGMAQGSRSGEWVDTIIQTSPGTYIGIGGGALIAGFGIWLFMRKTV